MSGERLTLTLMRASGDADRSGSAPRPARQSITRLTLSEFRNYRRLRLETASSPVVLTGPNGAGKTNVLEALSFLAPGRGLRNARLGEVRRRGAPQSAGWAVSARLDGPAGALEIGTGLDVEADGERRTTRIDGTPARRQAPLSARLGVLWLTPMMDRLFVEAPASRRRFLDRLVSGVEPGHSRQLAAFERSLRERGRLLAEGAGDMWLAAVEETLSAHAVAVAAARREAVAHLSAALCHRSGPYPRVALAVSGEVEGWLDEMAAVDVEQRLCDVLAESRRRDAETGGAAHGPHRSDVEVTNLDNGMPASQCSTGEQKALLIAIVLANTRLHISKKGAAPLLLLDELVAHLDARRRTLLLDAVLATGAQVWLTGTESALFESVRARAQFFEVGDGAVRRAQASGAL